MLPHVTRIAPSPTGLFHLGTARTALFNWLAAKASGGKFILRIDDTDVVRNVPECIEVIDQAMDWLGLGYNYRFNQSNRVDRYRWAANQLVKKGLAYLDGTAVRLRLNESLQATWQDTIAGDISISEHDRKVIDGLVLMRSEIYRGDKLESLPTYHFASVFDDMDCGVTWVIRGHDHLSNTAKHVAIWDALSQIDWPSYGDNHLLPNSRLVGKMPLWTHVGLITQDKRKLSKRDGAASVLSYRDQGIDRDAMCNWMLRLGWGPHVDDKTAKTIDRERAIELFLAAGNMRASPANMDTVLLASLDRKYKAKKGIRTTGV